MDLRVSWRSRTSERPVFALVFFLLSFSGCGDQAVIYQASFPTEDTGWTYDNTFSFDYSIDDTKQEYDLVLDVTHTKSFPYQNFYVNLETYLPDGSSLSQPLSLQLANNFGEWKGDCSGESCTISIALQEDTRFKEVGDYRLVVSQFTREEVLAEIEAVGFRILRGSH